MLGVPVAHDELPAEIWRILPPECSVRQDDHFFYVYQSHELIVTLNKRAGGAALIRLLQLLKQPSRSDGS